MSKPISISTAWIIASLLLVLFFIASFTLGVELSQHFLRVRMQQAKCVSLADYKHTLNPTCVRIHYNR